MKRLMRRFHIIIFRLLHSEEERELRGKKVASQKTHVATGKLEVWNHHVPTTIYIVDNQQVPNVSHREHYSASCSKLR